MNIQQPTTRSWRRLLFIAFPPLAAMVVTLLLVSPVWAATTVNIRIPFSGNIENGCNGAGVALSGEMHLTGHVTLDGSGGFHLGDTNHSHFTGTDTQGNSYEANVTVNFETNGHVGVAVSDMDRIRLVSKGSAPNFTVGFLMHITVNADGTVTASIDNVISTCTG